MIHWIFMFVWCWWRRSSTFTLVFFPSFESSLVFLKFLAPFWIDFLVIGSFVGSRASLHIHGDLITRNTFSSKTTIVSSGIWFFDSNDYQSIGLGQDIFITIRLSMIIWTGKGNMAAIIIEIVVEIPWNWLIHVADGTTEMNGASEIGSNFFPWQWNFTNSFSHTLRILKKIRIGSIAFSGFSVPTAVRIVDTLNAILNSVVKAEMEII